MSSQLTSVLRNDSRAARLEVAGLATLLTGAAAGRAIAPRYIRTLIPPWVPHPATVASLTGIAELILAAGLLHPTYRQRAARATGALISAYLISHLDAALRATPQQPRWLDRRPGVAVRLIVNAAYIVWSAHVATQVSDPERPGPTRRPRRAPA